METKTSEGNKDSTALQYYVIQRNTVLISLTPNFNKKISPVLLGTLVTALEPLDKLSLRLRVYDFNCDCEDWRNTEWSGHPTDCIPVSPIIWQYLAAVKVPNERVRLASDKLFCEYAKSIHREDKVWYHPNGDEKVKRLSVVKYIGKVPELGHGLYFGLDLVEPHEDSQTSELTKQYFNCVRSKGTFATLADISLFKKPSTTGFGIDKIITKNDLSTTVTIKDQTRSTNFDQKQHMHDLDIAFFDRLTSSSFDDKKNNNRDVAGTNSKEQLIQIQNDVCAMSFSNKHTDYSFPHSDSVPEKNELKKIVNREENTKDLQVGLNVKVLLDTDTHNGIIRWIGTPDGIAPGKLMAAVELDDGHPLGTDGTYEDVRYFKCRSHNAVFTDIDHCLRYDKMLPKNEDRSLKVRLDNYGNSEDSVIVGAVRPICVKGDLETMCGKDRGIQGHHNSCYLDATLFSMFTFTSAFDNLLFRPPNEKDCPEYEEVQRVLREEIVNPLRKKLYVHSDRVMKLRTLLEKLSSVSGLTSEEKDPEEFLTSLVAQILNAEPFLKLSSGQDAYHYQLFVEKDDDLNLPTVQQLLEQSFLTSNIRLKEVPSCLIIQMPRFGKSFKMYQKIQPTLLLDVTDIIEDSPRHCTVCGKLAEYECKECYGQRGVGLESIAFCSQCLAKVHQHERRTNHEPKKLSVPLEFTCLQEHCPVPRLYLELSAVVCIETSHYVSFVKCGSGSDAPWCFFDSMADRKGEQNGYNIPEMVPCSDFPYWLSEEGADFLKNLTDDRNLPEHAKRLLCDAYMCMYQSPDVMMYK